MRRVVTVLATLMTVAAAYAAATPTVSASPLSLCDIHPWHHKCQSSPSSSSTSTQESSSTSTQESSSTSAQESSSTSTQESSSTSTQESSSTSTQESSPTPTPEPGSSPGSAVDLGLQFHGTWGDYDDTTRGLVLDKIKASGATWVRLDVGWSMIQPEPGTYDHGWAVPKVDRVIEQVDARGLKLLVMFWQSPSWANGGKGERTAPSNPQDYANAIGWAATRWGNKVDAWEVWNEPNSDSFLTGADPATYVRLLCPAYRAVHANDADSRVVFGGVMYNDDDWIRSAYAAGAKGCFDVMATHPYLGPADAPPETADDGDVWTLRHVTAVRDVMLANGDTSPIWATEFGWSSHANTGGEEPWDRGVTEAQQADYAVRALRLFESDYPYVTKAFWYNEREKATGSPQQDGYGMLERDLDGKPVFYAFRKHLLGY